MAVLREAGLDEATGRTAFNVLSSYVVARAHFESYQRLVTRTARYGLHRSSGPAKGWQRLGDTVDEAPNTAAYVRLIGELEDQNDIFEHGLDLLLNGLRDEIAG